MALNHKNYATTLYIWRAEQKCRRIADQETWEGSALAFKAYLQTLVMVSLFQYLGRTLMEVKDDWQSVVTKLRKVQTVWSRLSRILGREGADARTFVSFYIAVFQVTLLF